VIALKLNEAGAIVVVAVLKISASNGRSTLLNLPLKLEHCAVAKALQLKAALL
jgi:hypothetical protein